MGKREIRELKHYDLYNFSKILKKIDLDLESLIYKPKKEAKKEEEKVFQMQFGLKLMNQIIANIHLANKEISYFFGSLVGLTPDEFDDLKMDESIDIIIRFFKGIDLANFFEMQKVLTQ